MSSIDAIGGATDTASSRPVENPGAVLDRDAFLKLLVAQLKYQDPTNPADTSQMLAQTAQLSMVDRLNEISEAFTTSNAAQRLSLAGTMVGREISFVGPEGSIVRQTVTSARLSTDGLVLVTDDYEVPYDAIAEVGLPEAPAPTTAPTGETTSTPDAATSSDPTSDGDPAA